MKILNAIGITLGLIAVGYVATYYTGLPAMVLITVSSAIWIAFDMRGRRLSGKGFPNNPVVAAICVLLLWIVAFPWYLVVR